MANTNEKDVKATIEAWARAVRDGDLEKVISMHTEDVVMFDVIPPFQIDGIPAFKKTWELFFEYNSGGEGSFNLSDIKLIAGDEMAYATAKLMVTNIKVRLTIVLLKVDNEWLISHEHHSVLEDDTVKAR